MMGGKVGKVNVQVRQGVEYVWVMWGKKVIGVFWGEALFLFGCGLVAENNKRFQFVVFFGVRCWGSNEVMELWTWVVHIGGFNGGIVERCEVLHCFVFCCKGVGIGRISVQRFVVSCLGQSGLCQCLPC